MTAEDVARAASFGDPVAVELLQAAGRRIGPMLASVVNFFNPSLVVIGGGVANSPDQFLAAIREAVYRRSLPLATRDLLIRRSSLGGLAGVIGASSMVVDQLFARESRIGRWLGPVEPAGCPTWSSRRSPRRWAHAAVGWASRRCRVHVQSAAIAPPSTAAMARGTARPLDGAVVVRMTGPESRARGGTSGASRPRSPALASSQISRAARIPAMPERDAVGRRRVGAVGPGGGHRGGRELDDAGRRVGGEPGSFIPTWPFAPRPEDDEVQPAGPAIAASYARTPPPGPARPRRTR